MTLLEMSAQYAESAAKLRERIVQLRAQARQAPSRDAAFALYRRAAALLPLWQEARDLAILTAHYYDKEGTHDVSAS